MKSSTPYERKYNPLSFKFALQLAAPHTWCASMCPALFGIFTCWLTGLPLEPLRAALLLSACILLQSAVNTLNDYSDFVKGTDSAEDHVEVSDATLLYGNIDPRSARNLGLAYLAEGLLLGLGGAWGKGPLPILVGLAGALVVLAYSGGPAPLSYLPLGELFSGFVMGGLIPLGIASCSDGKLHWSILYLSLPLILGIALIMMSNNGCDIEKDRRAGRITLPVLLGRERTLRVYRVAMILWLALLLAVSALLTAQLVLLCGLLILIFWQKSFQRILRLHLLPEERITQMKGIAAANLIGNGALLATILLKTVISRIDG